MKLRILLAEDNKGISFFYRALLEDLGHDVVATAVTAAEAEALAEAVEADLALLDIQLEGGSCYAAARAAQRRQLPIVFTSGYDEPPDMPEELADVPRLVKPLTEDDIKSVLKRFAKGGS